MSLALMRMCLDKIVLDWFPVYFLIHTKFANHPEGIIILMFIIIHSDMVFRLDRESNK